MVGGRDAVQVVHLAFEPPGREGQVREAGYARAAGNDRQVQFDPAVGVGGGEQVHRAQRVTVVVSGDEGEPEPFPEKGFGVGGEGGDGRRPRLAPVPDRGHGVATRFTAVCSRSLAGPRVTPSTATPRSPATRGSAVPTGSATGWSTGSGCGQSSIRPLWTVRPANATSAKPNAAAVAQPSPAAVPARAMPSSLANRDAGGKPSSASIARPKSPASTGIRVASARTSAVRVLPWRCRMWPLLRNATVFASPCPAM